MADDETVTELHECARYGELDEMKTWLEAHPTLSVDAMDGQGATPLHKACANGHVDIVQFLLSKGAKHVQNKNGAFPLSWAILNKHAAVVTLLLSAYQEINVLAPSMTSAKKSILSEGYDCGNADILNSLLQHSSAKALETEDGKAGAEGADGTNGAADEGELDANGLPAETKEQYVEEKESPVSAADLETQESLNKLKV